MFQDLFARKHMKGVGVEDLDLAIKTVLGTPEGRLFCWAILGYSEYFLAGFDKPDELLYKTGKRNVGQLLFHFIERHGDETFGIMKDEIKIQFESWEEKQNKEDDDDGDDGDGNDWLNDDQ